MRTRSGSHPVPLPGARHSLLDQERLSRLLLGLLTAACLLLSSWARVIPPSLDLQEGETCLRTIRAPRGGAYVDEEEMTRLRDEAASSVSDIYDADPNATEEVLAAVADVFRAFREARTNLAHPDAVARAQFLRDTLDIRLSAPTVSLALSAPDSSLARVENAVAELVRNEMGREIRSGTDDLVRARERLRDAIRGLGLTPRYAAMATEIGQAVLKNNRILNPEKTAKARAEKRDAVKQVVHQLQPGDIIILAGEEVRRRHIAAFQAVGLMQATIDYTQASGVLALCMLIVSSLWLFARRFAARCYRDFGQLVLVAALLVTTTFTYRILEPTSWFEPGAITAAVAVAMIVALLLDTLLALAVAIGLGMLLPIVAAGSDARLAITVILCASVGVFAVKRRGSQSSVLARAAPLVAVLNPLVLLVGGEAFGVSAPLRTIIIAAIGGLASPLLAVGAAIALERLVGVTTDMRLQELGNPNEAILRRLLAEAPGTYQHSVMVGNLAEAAAEAIGANALLVRVAAMYHDIGKISRPVFFVENQFGRDNPHDRLQPHLSAMIIAAHVKDGLSLAEQDRLPPAVKQGIAEHHGTTLIRYFYQRQLDQAPENGGTEDSAFRYPGPKPRSRETALLMLADSIEATARTLETDEPHQIEALVDRLVDEKIRDGQLDDSPLTFRDLAIARRSFVATLNSVYHHRIRYPGQAEQEADQAAREIAGELNAARDAVRRQQPPAREGADLPGGEPNAG